jgi:hypothetical protein
MYKQQSHVSKLVRTKPTIAQLCGAVEHKIILAEMDYIFQSTQNKTKQQTLWSKSASELYRPSVAHKDHFEATYTSMCGCCLNFLMSGNIYIFQIKILKGQ